MVRCGGAHRAHRRFLALEHFTLTVCDGSDEVQDRTILSTDLVARRMESDEKREEIVVITEHDTVIVRFLAAGDFKKWKQAFADATRDPATYYAVDEARRIGAGAFSTVYAVCERKGDTTFAMKVVNKKQCTRSELAHAETEARIMALIRHPAVVTCHDVFDSPAALHLVMDYVRGGTLDARINALVEECGRVPEHVAMAVMKRILSALKYLAAHGVVHRDLKPDNILVDGDEWAQSARLCDFGLGAFVGDKPLTEFVGTPHFVAPEVLTRNPDGALSGYGHEVDVWAAGVIAFWMLSGAKLPFDGEENADVCRAVRAGRFELRDDISEQGKSFVRALLNPDPHIRLSAAAALTHPWLTEKRAESTSISVERGTNGVDCFRTSIDSDAESGCRIGRSGQSLRAAALAVLAARRLSKALTRVSTESVSSAGSSSSVRARVLRAGWHKMRNAQLEQFVQGFG